MKGFISLCLLLFTFSYVVSAQSVFFQTGHTHDILQVKFSPDDKQLISYSAADGRLCLWEVGSGRLLWMTKTGFIRRADERINLNEFYWSQDRRSILTRSENGTFQVWYIGTGKIQALEDSKPSIPLQVSNREKIAHTKDGDKISLADTGVTGGRQIERFGNNSAYDVSNDGSMIAEGGSWGDASIRITEVKTGRSWWLDGHPSVVGGIAFSADGRSLAVGGSDKVIYIFDVPRRELTARLIGSTRPVKSLAFSPDGRSLISTEKFGVARVWGLKEGRPIVEVKAESSLGFESVSYSPDGKYFLLKTDSAEIQLWDAAKLEVAHRFRTKEKFAESSGGMTFGYDAVPVSSAAFSSDGKRIVAAYADGTIRVWGIQERAQLKKFKACENVTMAAYSRDGRKFIAYCDKADNERIALFDSSSGREVFRFNDKVTGSIKSISMSPDGKHFGTSDIVGDVYLWELNSPKPVREFNIGFSGDDAIAFSPDGKLMAVGGRNQNLFLFNTRTGEKLWQLIPSYQPGELETRLDEESKKRRTALFRLETDRDRKAAIETEKYRSQVYITFSHFGDMGDPGEKRIIESNDMRESVVKKLETESNAVWLRLHNDSPLPIKIPTQSMYLPNKDCFFEFPGGGKVLGLCDDREVYVWHGLQDKDRKWIPFGFDFGSSSLLLPKTSVVFPVPRSVLKGGNSIVFDYTFLNVGLNEKVSDYGPEMTLRFQESDLP